MGLETETKPRDSITAKCATVFLQHEHLVKQLLYFFPGA